MVILSRGIKRLRGDYARKLNDVAQFRQRKEASKPIGYIQTRAVAR
jgi:hypothetical protein